MMSKKKILGVVLSAVLLALFFTSSGYAQEKPEGFPLTVDYGWLTPVSAPLFWVLRQIYTVVQNWGWAIILLTVLVKLVFLPLLILVFVIGLYPSMILRDTEPAAKRAISQLTGRARVAGSQERKGKKYMTLYRAALVAQADGFGTEEEEN